MTACYIKERSYKNRIHEVGLENSFCVCRERFVEDRMKKVKDFP